MGVFRVGAGKDILIDVARFGLLDFEDAILTVVQHNNAKHTNRTLPQCASSTQVHA